MLNISANLNVHFSKFVVFPVFGTFVQGCHLQARLSDFAFRAVTSPWVHSMESSTRLSGLTVKIKGKWLIKLAKSGASGATADVRYEQQMIRFLQYVSICTMGRFAATESNNRERSAREGDGRERQPSRLSQRIRFRRDHLAVPAGHLSI